MGVYMASSPKRHMCQNKKRERKMGHEFQENFLARVLG